MAVLWAIARKDIYTTYTNRNFVLLILVMPLVMAVLLGAATSGLSRSGVPALNTPIAIVNDDKGNGFVNYGQLFLGVFLPDEAGESPLSAPGVGCPRSSASDTPDISTLVKAIHLNDAESARQAVDRGEFAAAIIVPPDFSQRIGYTPTHRAVEPVEIEVFANSAQSAATLVVRGITASITNQIVTGNIAVAAAVDSLEAHFGARGALAALDENVLARLACAFDPAYASVQIDRQFAAGARAGLDVFTYMAAAQAIFFLLFTALRGATDILSERQQGTLQRLIVAPIPQYYILAGKLFGTFVSCLLQLVLLYIAFSAANVVLKGQFQPIWGTDWIGLGLVMLAASYAASGLGMLVMSVSRSAEQAYALSGLLTTFMAGLGGAFFPVKSVPILNLLANLSPVYWGSDAFYRLAGGQRDIALHLAILAAQGTIMFGIGIWLFARGQKD